MAAYDRSIPAEISAEYARMEADARVALYQENYPRAMELFGALREFIMTAQERLHRGIHKGTVLYLLGIAQLGNRNNEAAARDVLEAYGEDALGTPIDYEDDADRAPAARLLIDLFVIDLRVLREIKAAARTAKADIPTFRNIRNTESILRQAFRQLNMHRRRLILPLCQNRNPALGPVPIGFPQPRERRVFVGTNYDVSSALIPEMRLAVIQSGYTPVIVRDVIIPPISNAHDVSLLLLHTCSYAVIDVTAPAGQFLEIERARDYGVNVLLLRNGPVGHQPHISAMITSLVSNQCQIQVYNDIPHMRRLIRNFLPH